MAGTFRNVNGVQVFESGEQDSCRIIDGVPRYNETIPTRSVQIKHGSSFNGHPNDTVVLVVTRYAANEAFVNESIPLTKAAALALSLELRKLAIGV